MSAATIDLVVASLPRDAGLPRQFFPRRTRPCWTAAIAIEAKQWQSTSLVRGIKAQSSIHEPNDGEGGRLGVKGNAGPHFAERRIGDVAGSATRRCKLSCEGPDGVALVRADIALGSHGVILCLQALQAASHCLCRLRL